MDRQAPGNTLFGMGRPLAGYRVLDLACEGGQICGLMLSEMGADVIKIEPPGGDPTRNIGPFYHDIPDPEKSLFWFAYNLNKRGITLNLQSADGRQIFKKLVKTAHFVVESFAPGYMESLGLGYPALEKINPGIIMASATPFGQTGPYHSYKGPDIVAMAMGGRMYMDGSPDHPPTRISFPQSTFNGGMDAAISCLLAHYYRETTGEGQYIDVAIEPGIMYSVVDVRRFWELNHILMKRAGTRRETPSTRVFYGQQWECKDGHVTYWILGGALGAKSMRALVKWMDEEGMATDYLKEMDWDKLDQPRATQEQIDRIAVPVAKFFKRYTRAEIYAETVKRGLYLLPVNTPKDVRGNRQLANRNWWVKIDHPELGRTITYPGVPFKMEGSPWQVRRRAPLIGEHNEEIYIKELKLPREKLVMLKQAGVI